MTEKRRARVRPRFEHPYRPGVCLEHRASGFGAQNHRFAPGVGIIVYAMIPTLMIVLSVMLRRHANRIVHTVVAAIFVVTIVGAAIGEWAYYLLASVVVLGLLAAIVVLSLKWTAAETQPAPDALQRSAI